MKKGFTLIELLVVVLIIGILSAAALPQYEKSVQKSRFVQLQVSLRTLFDAQKRYYLANGEYATTLDVLDVLPTGELTYGNKKIVNEKYSCTLVNHDLEIICSLYPDIGSSMITLLSRDTYQPKCRAYNDKGKKFCLTYGGVLDSNGNGWTDYTFK